MRRVGIVIALALAMPACALASGQAQPGGRLVIPRLHLNAPVGRVLDRGPAFYPQSARPGQPYTVAIAGHRTTHTHPFWALDQLRRGDLIEVWWRGREHVYRVTSQEVVRPTDWSPIRDRGFERLVLSTCNPRFSARQRLVVIALPVRRSGAAATP